MINKKQYVNYITKIILLGFLVLSSTFTLNILKTIVQERVLTREKIIGNALRNIPKTQAVFTPILISKSKDQKNVKPVKYYPNVLNTFGKLELIETKKDNNSFSNYEANLLISGQFTNIPESFLNNLKKFWNVVDASV